MEAIQAAALSKVDERHTSHNLSTSTTVRGVWPRSWRLAGGPNAPVWCNNNQCPTFHEIWPPAPPPSENDKERNRKAASGTSKQLSAWSVSEPGISHHGACPQQKLGRELTFPPVSAVLCFLLISVLVCTRRGACAVFPWAWRQGLGTGGRAEYSDGLLPGHT